MNDSGGREIAAPLLICRSDSCLFALPLRFVAETMRPQPLQPLRSMPPFLLGVSIIRGATVPIVSATRLIGAVDDPEPGRIVTLNIDRRQVGLAFASVIGLRIVPAELLVDTPPMLREAANETLSAIATLDARLLFVLQCVHLIGKSVWDELDRQRPQP